MQTTLLGLAMALIIALIAALVGPLFIDWNQFRPRFEAEAARVVGAPVRVAGALDARLLPTPTLRLRSVVVGKAGALGQEKGLVRADKLDVEFSLGALMRGEVRATELTVGGLALDLALDPQGRLDWPAASAFASLGALSIDRLNLTGRIVLHDAASHRTLELNDIAFSGEVRGAAGSLRGDGNFMLAGERMPFRLSAGRPVQGSGTRLHLTLESSARAASLDLEGLLNVEARVPQFDGVVTLASAAAMAAANADAAAPMPWRLAAKLKADPAAARFDQLEASYGAEAAALRLAGSAELRLGASPQLHVALSARQLDADRLLGQPSDAATPARWLQGLPDRLAAMPKAGIATRLEIGVEQAMFGGRAVQNLAADLHSDAQNWIVDRLGFRAPGGTQTMISNGLIQPGATDSLRASLAVDSADPDLLAAWLTGRAEIGGRAQKPFRLNGEVSAGAGGFAIEAVKAELDGGRVAGRLALSRQAGGSRLDAALKAERLDLDAAGALLRALAGPQAAWPDAAKLQLEVAEATWAGQALKPLLAQLGYGPDGVTLDRLRIGDANSVLIESAGALDRQAGTGKLTVDATAATLGRIAELIAPLAPVAAARLDASGVEAGPAHLTLAVALDPRGAATDRGAARATLELDAPQLKGRASFTASPLLTAIRSGDVEALRASDVKIESNLSSERGAPLLVVLGLDGLIAAGPGAARLEASATGSWRAPLKVSARLQGAELDAELKGSGDPWAAEPNATLDLAIRRANIAPLLARNGADAAAASASLTSRLVIAGQKLGFDDIDGAVAGSRLRGRLALTMGDQIGVDGAIGLDSLELAPVLRLALGAAGKDQTAPLGRGALQGWRGQLAFEALRGVVPGGIELRPVSGLLRSDGGSLIIDKLTGKIGGGDAVGDIAVRRSADGVALDARLKWSGVDGAALRYRALAMPAGKTSLQMTLSSQGRSGSALASALTGSGLLTIDTARIAGLDAGVFVRVIAAGQSGAAVDEDRLLQIVDPLLARGTLAVARAQIPFSIEEGRWRVSPTTLDGDGVRLVVSGGYDGIADQADLRASLTSTATSAEPRPPEILIFAAGSPDGLTRSVDVAGLSSWLAGRRIDAETRRLQAIEREEVPAIATPASIPPVAPPSPAAESPPPGDSPSGGQATDLPVASVPMPERDPRDAAPKPKLNAVRPPVRPATPSVIAGPQVNSERATPLPPPINVRPAPGDGRPRLRPPLQLTPPAALPARPAF
ncbi:AsmA family protein [Rhodopseudomonas palustris]|uniref:AsmA n=1 Tax=Rhodopseudomonas palustris (strain BisB18) TaxID=316056 RepID=Q211X0_RHOPB